MVVTNSSIQSKDITRSDATFIWAECGPEEAKAIGIKHAKGEICAMFCADNKILGNNLFTRVHKLLSRLDMTGAYTRHFAHVKHDNSLNRYFSLIGNNDPIAFYLGKCDRKPYYQESDNYCTYDVLSFPLSGLPLPSFGDNGFFVKRHILLEDADLDHYYPMDVYVDINRSKAMSFVRFNYPYYLWHRTSDNLISFLKKRYRYARDLYCDRSDRRWKMLETKQDYWNLLGFVLSTITFIPAICISIRGWRRIRDTAWFWHPIVCWGFLITYTILTLRNLLKHGRLFQCPQARSSYQRLAAEAP